MKKASKRRAALGREEKAFLEEFYGEYHSFIWKETRRYVNDLEMREEVFSEACLSLVKTVSKLRGLEDNKRPIYIVTIVRNCAYQFLRDQKREREVRVPWDERAAERMLTQEDPEDAVLRREDFARVRADIGKLPPKERDALLLKIWTDMDYRGIASLTGIAETSVHTYIRRARERLRKTLYIEEDGD